MGHDPFGSVWSDTSSLLNAAHRMNRVEYRSAEMPVRPMHRDCTAEVGRS
jgi:hypothetical protein